VKIVIDKNKSPVINGSKNDGGVDLTNIKDKLNEMLSSEKDNQSTTFILIAGVIIVLVFVALFLSKMLLTRKVLRSHQKNAELVAS